MAPSSGCRACGSEELAPIVSLGNVPLANRYLSAEQLAQPEPRYPLDLVRCRVCALVQITEIVPPEILFRDYLYFSSYSATMVAHAQQLVSRLIDERRLSANSLAVEVASNDGYLLQFYVAAGVPVLGIEPARNVAQVAEERGIRTLPEFFSQDLAKNLSERADVIHAHNVMAHVADLNGFVAGLHTLLKDDGVLVAESPYLRPFLEKNEFDTIYHEHLYYYSLTALNRLLKRHGLIIVDCEQLDIHGGSLRIFAQRSGAPSARVQQLLDEEAAWGVDVDAPYSAFAGAVERIKVELTALVRQLVAEGKRVAGYGAAAKATVLLNTTGLSELAFVCDKSPHKQGRFMPGVHTPIVSPEQLAAEQPDYCVLFVWNIADEVMAEQRAYRGRFILAVPSVKVA
jgi:SAM-dependent methyltransferase